MVSNPRLSRQEFDEGRFEEEVLVGGVQKRERGFHVEERLVADAHARAVSVSVPAVTLVA